MKTEKKISTATRSAQPSAPFFSKAGEGNFFAPAVQTKMTLGKSDDKYEKEADSIAESVVQRSVMPDIHNKCADCEQKDNLQRKPLAAGITPFIQRKAGEDDTDVQRKEDEEEVQARRIQRKEDEEKAVQMREDEEAPAKKVQCKEEDDDNEKPVQTKHIQRKESNEEEETAVQAKSLADRLRPGLSAVEAILNNSKGLGYKLPDAVRTEMEAGYGVDLSKVRIHTGEPAVNMSESLGAQAFTHGWDVFFNKYKYNPNTRDGKLLLAHELAHTLQQAKAHGEVLHPARSRAEQEIPLVPDEQAAAPERQVRTEAGEIQNEQIQDKPKEQSVAERGGQRTAPRQVPPQGPTLPPCKPKAQGQSSGGASPKAESASSPQETPEAAPQPGNATPASAAAASPPPVAVQAPKCPADDPEFAKAKKQISSDAKKQRRHEPAEQKRDEAMAAATLPMAEQNLQSGQEQQAEVFEAAAQPKPFDRVEFKRKLTKKIESKMPENEDQAKAFAKSGKLEEAKEEFKDSISEEKGKVTGPLEQAGQQKLPPGQNIKPDNVEVPGAPPADKPGTVPTGTAAPKPRTDEEISLEYKSRGLDDQMTREGLTEKQLEESEEPQFEQALQSKRDAQREIAAAPGHYRLLEEQQLDKSKNQANRATGRELNSMATSKTSKTGEVFGSQKIKESATEKRQREIKETIDGIYLRTENEVHIILEDLGKNVETTFSENVEAANETFKSRVHSRLDDHYGWFTFDDKIAEWAGLSDGVAHIFKEEKERFLTTMDTALGSIAETVEHELNRALERIKKGRTEMEDFKTTLSADELKFAEEMLAEAMSKFSELEASVNESQEELIETLSDQYVESVNKLQEEFDKINEELSASWIADALSFIGDVATAIKKLGQLLSSIAARIGQYISDILASPKRFFNNLVDGIKGGMDEFSDKIDTYLEQGFWMWLTGASSAAKIEIPKKMDAEGMFSLATQILGITKAFIFERIKAVLRISVDAFLALVEKAKDVGGKVLEPVKILLTQGPGALWQWVKDEVSGHLTEIFNKIKEDIFNAIIKKFLLWVASLFIPGLGFIKLIQAAYKALKWLVDNIERIVEIVNTFLDAVGLAVQGNVSAIKQKVVKALTNGVVIAIDFLAKLVGLGNFGDKLQRGIEMLRKPVRKVIDAILRKARPVVKKIQKAMMKVKGWVRKKAESGKKAFSKLFNWGKTRKQFKTKDGATHHVFVEKTGKSAKLMIASEKKNAKKLLKELAGRYAQNKEKLFIIDRSIELTGTIEDHIIAIGNLEDKLLKAKDDSTRDAIYRQIQTHYDNLMVLESILTTRLFDILESDNYNELLNIYAIEGQVGVHNAGPKKRGMFEADHQPSNKILKTAAEEPSAPPLLSQVAASRSKWASTITIGRPRHVKGRTWGNKAKEIGAEFKIKTLPELKTAKSDRERKSILETALQREAIEDAKFMIELVNNTPLSDNSIWGDINKKPHAKELKDAIIKQIGHGESVIMMQKVSIPTKV